MTLLDQLKKDNKKESQYNNRITYKLYKQCVKEIKRLNSDKKHNCIFTIPYSIQNYKEYDFEVVKKKLFKKLKKEGLDIKIIDCNKLIITWKLM